MMRLLLALPFLFLAACTASEEPKETGRLCTDEEIEAYRAETGTGLNNAALRAAGCPDE